MMLEAASSGILHFHRRARVYVFDERKHFFYPCCWFPFNSKVCPLESVVSAPGFLNLFSAMMCCQSDSRMVRVVVGVRCWMLSRDLLYRNIWTQSVSLYLTHLAGCHVAVILAFMPWYPLHQISRLWRHMATAQRVFFCHNVSSVSN